MEKIPEKAPLFHYVCERCLVFGVRCLEVCVGAAKLMFFREVTTKSKKKEKEIADFLRGPQKKTKTKNREEKKS